MSTTAAPRSVRDPGPTRRLLVAALAAATGLCVTALGTGIAVRYAMKQGLTATALLGAVVLLVGLTAFVLAWRVAWRATPRWKRLWFAPLALVVLLSLFSMAQGTMLALTPRTSLGSSTPGDLGLRYEEVAFSTSDGVRLSAWFLPGRNGAAVITVPGAGSTRTATLRQAAVLARHGYAVLMVDPRGQGRSEGRGMDAGWYGDRDLGAAVRYLRQSSYRVGVLGLSMGGEAAIGAAAAVPEILAVVAEGATHRTAADKAGYLPGGLAGAVQRVLDRLTFGTAALLSPAPRPATLHSAVRRADATPFLLIAGGGAVDETEASAYLEQAAPERVETWTVPRATHTHGLDTAPEEWASRVTAFFDRALLEGDGVPGREVPRS